MKKWMAALVLLLCLCMLTAGALAEEKEALNDGLGGMTNVKFEDSYYGFCIVPDVPGAAEGDTFDVAGTSGNILHVETKEDVSNLVKCAVIESFNDLFSYYPDENGCYYLPGPGAQNKFFGIVWRLIGKYEDANTDTVSQGIIDRAKNRAETQTIGDNHTEKVNSVFGEKEINFDFKVFLTQKEAVNNVPQQQNFFAFRVAGMDAALTPDDPTDPDDPDVKDQIAKLPKTGDESNLMLFAGLLAASLTMMGALRRRAHK